MGRLSEVSQLFGERVGDIERARTVFTSETRNFVGFILTALRQMRPDPWTAGRIRIDLPDEIEREAKASSNLGGHYAIARSHLRFKKQTKFVRVAEVPFGVQFDEGEGAFRWRISLVPLSRYYYRLDDVLWLHFRNAGCGFPGGLHDARRNTVQFVSRPLGEELTSERAFEDVKAVFDCILTADAALADAVGVDLSEEEAAVSE